MQYRELRIRNFKCFNEWAEVRLGKGFNFVVGQNNAGKSALLSAFSTNETVLHRSHHTLPREGDEPGGESEFNRLINFSEDDLFRDGVPFTVGIVAPVDLNEAPAILTIAQQVGLDVALLNDRAIVAGAHGFKMPRDPVNEMRQWTRYVNQPAGVQIVDQGLSDGEGRNFSNSLLGRVRTKATDVYRFAAERLNVGTYGGPSESRDLTPNASNLPEVINKLQELPGEKARFIELVRYVLPQIKDVTSESKGGLHLIVWPDDGTGSDRRDLAVKLQDSGTGIGQVLAILYVASHYKTGKVIVIDEINAFLHPDAARRLLEALARFPQHQYIIATHNPSLLTMVKAASVVHVTSDGSQSFVQNISEGDVQATQRLLQDVGVRLSDVFTAERILWVEGPTEETVFKELLLGMPETKSGVQVLGIVNTGDLESGDRKLAAQVYERLSKGGGLLPPDVAFIMDPEGRTPKELVEMSNRMNNRAFFLDRRLFESYLLDPDAIATVLNKSLTDRQVDAAEVINWINTHGEEDRYKAKGLAPMQGPWLKAVHGAELLKALFTDLSEATVEFRKTRHAVDLARWVQATKPGMLDEVRAVIRQALSSRARS